jgi:glycosyltransferase involved in cell wall biosynthesis
MNIPKCLEPSGGSEIAYKTLLSKLNPNEVDDINLISSSCSEELIDKNKINVLWQHLSFDQTNVQKMADPNFVNKIDHFVYVSHWQYEKFRNVFKISEDRSSVIKNAVEFIPFNKRPEKIKIIYTSTPWRGLDVLLDAYELLNRDDIELDVYSSTAIYGPEFYYQNDHKYHHLYEKAASLKNSSYKGYAENSVIRDAVSNAHIFAYPSTFEETSCICAIEAAMAGCSLVTTNYGALFETLGEWSRFVEFDKNKKALAEKFAIALNDEINKYWQEFNQQKLLHQHIYYANFYGWNLRVQQWKELFKKLRLTRFSN